MSLKKEDPTFYWEVSEPEAGMKLVAFLSKKIKDAPSNRELKRKIEANLCKINGRVERFASKEVSVGDQITFFDEGLLKKAPLSFEQSRVLFEDADYLIYDKPAGMTCDKRVLDAAGFDRLALAHRLDKETTGALIFSKRQSALELMEKLFKERKVKKTYLAWVDGVPPRKEGVIENFLVKRKSYAGNAIYGEASSGQLAITEWAMKRQGKSAALLECHPLTGRTHQIRVHLSGLGHPILGDYIYGYKFLTLFRPKRILLHSYKISFTHPVTSKPVEAKAPIPEDFMEAEKALI